MYYIHNSRNDHWQAFSTWWKLIEFFYVDDSYWNNTINGMTGGIAHNENDKRVLSPKWDEFNFKHINLKYEPRPIIVYDNDFTVVNVSEIRESLKIFKPREEEWRGRRGRFLDKNPFIFRKDPVPGIWGNVRACTYSRIKKNKTYAAKLQEYYFLFPNDSRMKQRMYLARAWSDELGPSSKQGRSWKKKRIKKQWMKHI